MRGDQLARQCRSIREIEASPNALTGTEIAQREETGIRTIYRGLEALEAAGFPLYTERVERASRWASVDTFNFKIPAPFTLTEPIPFYFYKDCVCKSLVEPLAQEPVIGNAVDLMMESRLFDLGHPG